MLGPNIGSSHSGYIAKLPCKMCLQVPSALKTILPASLNCSVGKMVGY